MKFQHNWANIQVLLTVSQHEYHRSVAANIFWITKKDHRKNEKKNECVFNVNQKLRFWFAWTRKSSANRANALNVDKMEKGTEANEKTRAAWKWEQEHTSKTFKRPVNKLSPFSRGVSLQYSKISSTNVHTLAHTLPLYHQRRENSSVSTGPTTIQYIVWRKLNVTLSYLFVWLRIYYYLHCVMLSLALPFSVYNTFNWSLNVHTHLHTHSSVEACLSFGHFSVRCFMTVSTFEYYRIRLSTVFFSRNSCEHVLTMPRSA